MGLSYEEKYQVPFYESDANHNMKLPQLLSLALQISGKQSLALGMSDELIFERYHLVWVVTEYTIAIKRLPHYGESIRIRTEPLAYNKLFCYRAFQVFSDSGDLLVTIEATFVLMDYQTRKVHQVLEAIVSPFGIKKSKKLKRGPKYAPLVEPQTLLQPVHFFDLDLNGHVNNGKYLEWMYAVLDDDLLKDYIPKTIHLNYLKEVHVGQTVASAVIREATKTQHAITCEGHISAQAQIKWQRREITND